MRKTSSIKSKLNKVIIIPAIFVLMLLIGAVLFNILLLKSTILQQLNFSTAIITEKANAYLNGAEILLNTISYSILDLDLQEKYNLLKETMINNGKFTIMYLLDEKGRVLVENTGTDKFRSFDLSGESFYKGAISTGKLFYSEPFISIFSDKISVTISLPIIRNNKIEGILIGELNLIELQHIIDNLTIIENASIFIADDFGRLIAHPNHNWVQERRIVIDNYFVKTGLNKNNYTGFYFDKNLKKWILGRTAKIKNNWLVVITQDRLRVIYPLFVFIVISIVGFIITIMFFLLLQLKNINKITEAIFLFIDKTESLSKGSYKEIQKDKVNSFSEINRLSRSFSRMIKAIKDRDRYLEQRVKDRTSELEKANKELELFSYSISHDLKAPIRAINGYSTLLEEEYKKELDENGKNYIEIIRNTSKKMGELIEGLLLLLKFKKTDLKIEKTNLSDIAQKIIMNYLALNLNRKINYYIEPNLYTFCDKLLINAVLENLINNALKFTEKKEIAEISLNKEIKNNKDIFILKDNGAGFDMNYYNKLFGIFQRLHHEHEFTGHGIGLAIVQSIIHKHGGEIWANSEIGKGTIFYFTLTKK